MGVPIGRLLCASNENNVLADFIATGVYDICERAFVTTPCPSMDILISSNLERLLYHLARPRAGARLDGALAAERQRFQVDPRDLPSIRELLRRRLREQRRVARHRRARLGRDGLPAGPAHRGRLGGRRALCGARTPCSWCRPRTGRSSARDVLKALRGTPLRRSAAGRVAALTGVELLARVQEMAPEGACAPRSLAELDRQPERFTDVVDAGAAGVEGAIAAGSASKKSEVLVSYRESGLWTRAFGSRDEQREAADARQKLATCYADVRQRAASIGSLTVAGLPGYTAHDLTHSDRLWALAELICGPDYPLNPIEAFALGCAFLVHDLGLAMVPYLPGYTAVESLPNYDDAMRLTFLRQRGHLPTDEEIVQAPSEVRDAAAELALRETHALRARDLAVARIGTGINDEPEWLIEDSTLRHHLGRIIGLIAASHGGAADSLTRKLPRTIGAPYPYPASWQLDPVKVACILRTADAAHVDSSRARAFDTAVRHVPDSSIPYWRFQTRLAMPVADGDSLLYTSGAPFTRDEAAAWWLCAHTLAVIDEELRAADAVLADTGRPRFVLRGVAGARGPARLAEHIPTQGWLPVEARLHVSNPTALAEGLGGASIYGNDRKVLLRELVQMLRMRCGHGRCSSQAAGIPVASM